MSYLRNQPYDEKDFPAFAAIREQLGFLPNFFVEQTARPDMVNTEIAMTGNLIVKEGALPRRQKEYIFLVYSAANHSTYCVTAHCEMVRMLGIKGPEPEQIALDHTVSDLPDREKALLDLAVKLNNRPREVSPADMDELRAHGFADE